MHATNLIHIIYTSNPEFQLSSILTNGLTHNDSGRQKHEEINQLKDFSIQR